MNRGETERWAREWEIAGSVLSGEPGTLTRSTVDHEAFRYEEATPDGRTLLIFYPHKTTARNYHLRIRANRWSERALELADRLDKAAGFGCTFRHSGRSR